MPPIFQFTRIKIPVNATSKILSFQTLTGRLLRSNIFSEKIFLNIIKSTMLITAASRLPIKNTVIQDSNALIPTVTRLLKRISFSFR